ncbi:hypothetical protein N7530_001181 [Penicillium desertorum]|uniref:Uncharacterized protein n=1 Tax=Penicillium desertorum TaxID=1303715 RepID=A0A9W9XA89_9EURO|nr:hypothetical protein N7530_001181 [Penicillium desertorum]
MERPQNPTELMISYIADRKNKFLADGRPRFTRLPQSRPREVTYSDSPVWHGSPEDIRSQTTGGWMLVKQ